MIIGITGGTGCGKTTLLNVIETIGGTVFDCDAIYHGLLQTNTELLTAIEARFPSCVVEGCLQRKKLGAIVFADKAALEDLNQIAHKFVYAAILQKLETAGPLVAIDAIGLFEGKLDELCDVTVAVTAPEECRIARLVLREGISEEYARSRIAAQRPQEEFQALCNYSLVNDGTQGAFREKCLAFLAQLGIMKE